MKLLGWMHRKFRQGSGEPLKDFSLGHPSLDDIQCYPKSNYFAKSTSKSQRDNLLRKSFACTEVSADSRTDEVYQYYDHRDSSTEALSDLFRGFLAIGTLGGDPLTDDPYSTPTFSICMENIAEKETEVTENDLRMINDELEKVLGGDEITSGRNSMVSNARSSYCGTITLSGKQLENIESGGATNICPLQGYLFGSAVGLPETTAAGNKKEPRPSLGELFQKTKMVDENSQGGNKGEKQRGGENNKENEKSAVHLLKKILKKRIIHSSSSSKGSTTDSAAETKLNKVLQMFHKKVHPESIGTAAKVEKGSNKSDNLSSSRNTRLMYDSVFGSAREDVALMPKRRRMSRDNLRRLKSQSSLRRHQLAAIASADPNANKECWIKSDADYLVLEL
ncbi:unnamed protein product [Cuscuta europaea]|uniref:Uncharacterized protein n=1 Tax=Cuscuta europaea TaxID=41803 RepID=A0A9P0ZUL1_CUSEU|nr:unnamed protein product [Cuscuta europaea]